MKRRRDLDDGSYSSFDPHHQPQQQQTYHQTVETTTAAAGAVPSSGPNGTISTNEFSLDLLRSLVKGVAAIDKPLFDTLGHQLVDRAHDELQPRLHPTLFSGPSQPAVAPADAGASREEHDTRALWAVSTLLEASSHTRRMVYSLFLSQPSCPLLRTALRKAESKRFFDADDCQFLTAHSVPALQQTMENYIERMASVERSTQLEPLMKELFVHLTQHEGTVTYALMSLHRWKVAVEQQVGEVVMNAEQTGDLPNRGGEDTDHSSSMVVTTGLAVRLRLVEVVLDRLQCFAGQRAAKPEEEVGVPGNTPLGSIEGCKLLCSSALFLAPVSLLVEGSGSGSCSEEVHSLLSHCLRLQRTADEAVREAEGGLVRWGSVQDDIDRLDAFLKGVTCRKYGGTPDGLSTALTRLLTADRLLLSVTANALAASHIRGGARGTSAASLLLSLLKEDVLFHRQQLAGTGTCTSTSRVGTSTLIEDDDGFALLCRGVAHLQALEAQWSIDRIDRLLEFLSEYPSPSIFGGSDTCNADSPSQNSKPAGSSTGSGSGSWVPAVVELPSLIALNVLWQLMEGHLNAEEGPIKAADNVALCERIILAVAERLATVADDECFVMEGLSLWVKMVVHSHHYNDQLVTAAEQSDVFSDELVDVSALRDTTKAHLRTMEECFVACVGHLLTQSASPRLGYWLLMYMQSLFAPAQPQAQAANYAASPSTPAPDAQQVLVERCFRRHPLSAAQQQATSPLLNFQSETVSELRKVIVASVDDVVSVEFALCLYGVLTGLGRMSGSRGRDTTTQKLLGKCKKKLEGLDSS